MRKKLLLAAIAMVCSMGIFAQETTYVYTASQRFKVTGENVVVNGDFSADGTDKTAGWTDATGAGVNAEVWTVGEGEGPNGENVLKSVATTSGEAICNKWAGLNGTYVVSFDIKGESYANTGNAAGANCVDFFINTDGALTKVASTDEAPVINVATGSHFNAEWKTIAFSATVEEGQILVMHFEQLAVGTMITNIQIRPATEVYDIRPLKRKVAFVNKVIEDPNFKTNESEALYGEVAGIVEMIESMIDTPEMENTATGESIAEGLDGALEDYLAITSKRVNSLLTGTETSTLAATGKINRGDNNGLKKNFPNLDLTGGSWRHDPANCDYIWTGIQKGYHNEGTYNVFHDDFPAGKYFIAGSIRNANTDSKTNLSWNLGTACKIFVGKDSVVTDTIIGEDYQKFFLVGTIDEDGAFRAGFEWPGVEGANGGAFYVRDVEVRAFNQDIEDAVLHVQAWKKYVTQWNAAVGAKDVLWGMVKNGNYPWGQTILADANAAWYPVFCNQRDKNWMNEDGKDAGIASTDELNDWALYQGYAVTGVDSIDKSHEYQLVRGYQNAINSVKTLNKPFTDLATAIDEAKKTRNKAVNATGDRATFKTAIETAIATITSVRATTSDATRVADSTTLADALVALNAATETFLNSQAQAETIADIDFSNPFAEDETDGSMYIAGTTGRMVFSVVDTEHDPSSTAFQLGYQPDGGELVYGDVLRIGNGTGTFTFAEEPAENSIITAQFDVYFGNFSGKNAYFDFRNAAGTKIAGFSMNRYNGTMEYNDFNNEANEGMDVLKYATGIGKSGQENNVIYNESTNKSTFTLTVNYAKGTVQGKLANVKNGTIDGKEIALNSELDDNKVMQFVIGSNYNNSNRRCWFDNLKITKAVAAASEDFPEDINDSPWADTSAIQEVANNSKANVGVIYSITGVRLNAVPQKGMYIMNGKKYVVK